MKALERFQRYGTHIHNGQDQLKNHIFDRFPVLYTDNVDDRTQVESYKDYSDYVWLVDKNIKIYDSFPWYFKPQQDEEIQNHAFPYVYKESRKVKSWNKCQLVPTKIKTEQTKQHIYICGEYDVYKGKDQFDMFYIGNNQNEIAKLTDRFQNIQIANNIKDAQQKSYTDMLWIIYDDTIVRDTFKFTYHPDEWSHDYVHVFGNGDIDQLDGISLIPKNYQISEKEEKYRFFINKKEIRIMASNPSKFDSFIINNYKDYQYALENSKTDMFWGIPSDVIIADDFDFSYYISHHDVEKRNQNHVFLNDNKYDGIVLFSKFSPVTEKEIAYKFISNRIEHDVIASSPKPFDQFTIDNYSDYKYAIENSKTDMFWGIPSDVKVSEKFKWDNFFKNRSHIDRTTTHVFLNGDHYDGIVLYSKSNNISEKEVDHRFYVNKKEWDIIASKPKPYDKFTINNYEDYTKALYESKTEMFWGIPSDVIIADDFDFDFYFSHHNRFDREINHVFLNDKYYDGLVLFSKHSLVSEKEVDHRFYVNKKEWDIIASKPKPYDKFYIKSYQDYLDAKENSSTDMFWLINPDIIVQDDFDFDFYIDYHNQYERKMNHVWLNGKYYDGIFLTSKNIQLSKREIEFRFLANKKEYNYIASKPKPYDIVFISYDEPNAEENWQILKARFPKAQRVHGVKGIHQAHIEAAKLCDTDMFWVVDGDAQILDSFEFDYQIAHYDIDGKDTVHVWRSFNPVNNLVYGYGGVKLLPKKLTIDMDTTSSDMTTSISDKFKAVQEMSNSTVFNTDEFSAWKSAFRECCKLASKTISRQVDDETDFRLNAWCTRGLDKPFGKAAIAGARAGKKFGEKNKENTTELQKINDFDWLYNLFRQLYQSNE